MNRERVGGNAEKDNGNNKVRCICFLSLRRKKRKERQTKKRGKKKTREDFSKKPSFRGVEKQEKVEHGK